MIILVMAAHVGRDGEKSRYLFSHMMLIALFLDVMSRRSSPPLFIGQHSTSHVILGEGSSSHMKPLMILFSAISMWVAFLGHLLGIVYVRPLWLGL